MVLYTKRTKGMLMKNFCLGVLACLCLTLLIVQSYMVFCPHFARERDIHVTNQMILPYDGFVLKPFNNGPVFPHGHFPFTLQEQNAYIEENKTILPQLVE